MAEAGQENIETVHEPKPTGIQAADILCLLIAILNGIQTLIYYNHVHHVLTSAVFFAFLTIALVAAQFRKRRVALTITGKNIAAAMADSDMPQKCVEMIQYEADTGQRKVLKLVPSGDSDGQFNCAYQNIN